MSEQRVGPRVRVSVEYECNGCQYHRIDEDKHGMKFHACHHPAIIEEFKCPQYLQAGNKNLTIYHIAKTPKHMCPYIVDKE